MTEQPQQYYDGQIVNGWRYVAATNSWVQATGPNQPVTLYTNEYGLTPAKPTPWGKIIGLSLAGLFGLILLLGIIGAIAGGTDTQAPVQQQAAPVQPAPQPAQPAPAPVQPAPQPVQPDPEPFSDDDIADTALQLAWDNLDADQQEGLCLGWNSGLKEEGLDVFEESSGGAISRDKARAFFDEKCA